MYEKLYTLRLSCSTVGIVSLFIYIILCFSGSSSVVLVLRVITAAIALAAYSIQCGAAVMDDEKLGDTISMIALCLFDILVSAIMLI